MGERTIIIAYENAKTYEIVPSHYQSVALNLRGTGSIYNNRNVNLYNRDGSSDQKWYLRVYSGYAKILCSADHSYGLDYYYGSSNKHNCDIYQEAGNEDSKIDLITVNASLNYYKLKLCSTSSQGNGRYLTASSLSSGADVRWMPNDGDSDSLYQIWKLIEVNAESSSSDTIYSGILARSAALSTKTGSSSVIVTNIPDKLHTGKIEYNVQFHPACGLSNNLDFNNSSSGSAIKSQLQKYVKKVFGSEAMLSDDETCYYLWAEREANTSGARYHSGVDVSYYDGAPIHALFGGKVKYAGGPYGTVSIFNPTLGVTFNYVHMNGITVSAGNGPDVVAGEIIGYQSNVSLDNIGSHLHFEIRPGEVSTGPAGLPTQPSQQMTTVMPYGYMDGII